MKQIVIAMKGKHFDLRTSHFFDKPQNVSETRLRDKELWDPGYTAKTGYHSEKETQAAP